MLHQISSPRSIYFAFEKNIPVPPQPPRALALTFPWVSTSYSPEFPVKLHIRELLCCNHCQSMLHLCICFHVLHLNFPPFPLHMFGAGFISSLFLTLRCLWPSQRLIWIVKATTVRDNPPVCKGLMHIDLQMSWDQSRLDTDLFTKCVPPRSFPWHIQHRHYDEDEGKHTSV